MQFNPDTDYKKLITELIKKQIIVLGPYITLAKARNVKGLAIDDDGTVTGISGRPQEVIQGLVDQFVQLSGLIVKKTMEPLLAGYPDGITTNSLQPQESAVSPAPQVNMPIDPQQTSQPQATPNQPTQTTETNKPNDIT